MKKLYLSDSDKKIAGVCGGIAETYEIDPSLVRIVFVLVCLLTAILPMVLTYLIAWMIIPKKPKQ